MITNFDYLGYIFLILSGFYFSVLIAVYVGLNRLRTGGKSNRLNSISIVIAARNEESRISPCLQSLTRLNYPSEKYEIIFIDDQSSDGTAKLIERYCEKYNNWQLIRLDKKSRELRGKKNALLHGIEQAKGEVIFTTDADCIIPEGWLRETVRYFTDGTAMVLGFSPLISQKGVIQRFLQFDNLFSAISAAAPTKLGYPFTSVGRNLAYRKDAYENAGGFLALKKFRSGDDVHLTERFRYLNQGFIDYCANSKAFVTTHVPDSIKEIFHQQIRKNSKILKKAGTSIGFSLILFLYYMLLIIIPIILPHWRLIWLIFLIIKLVVEYIDLLKAAKIFNQKQLIKIIPLMQIIYPAYIIFFSLLGILDLYNWKK